MNRGVVWSRGGEAQVVAVSGTKITLLSTRPAPPGARLEGLLPSGRVVRVKVHGCRRRDDGGFSLEGRGLDWTREVLEELSSLAPDASEA